MAIKPLPSPEVLRQLLRYEPDTGKLFWKRRPLALCAGKQAQARWNTIYEGREAMTAMLRSGYRCGLVLGRSYLAHRIAWSIFYGDDPRSSLVDHINRDKADNRIANLRLATKSENQMNKVMCRGSRFKGVSYWTAGKVWQASIRVNGKKIHLGSFKTEREAATAYDDAALKVFGEFSLTNRMMGLI